jgi:hypothetical protein
MDEDAGGDALCKALETIDYLNITTVVDCGFGGKGDDVIVKKAKKLNKILVTANINDLNEKTFPPCGHGGIIVFNKNELKPEYVLPRIKAIKALDLMDKIKSHVTKIYDEHIDVYTLEGTCRAEFKDNAKTKKIYKRN